MTDAAAVAPARPSAARLDSLTGARFLAALGVFLYHAALILPPTGVFAGVLGFVGRDGAVGVDFFFVLSGFVLAWSWREGGSIAAFYRRRFARIAPAYWAALVYGLVWVVWLYRDPIGASVRSIPTIVGVQAWSPDPAVHFAANGVEWSVSAELFFYALFPLLIRVAGNRHGLIVIVTLSVLLGVALPTALAQLPPSATLAWASDILPAARLGEFICGMLLAVLMRRGLRLPVGPKVAIALFLVAYAVLPSSPSWLPQRPVFLLTILLVVGALVQVDRDGASSLLARRLPVRLGEWSYCFYLVHQVTAQVALFACAAVVPARLLGPVWLAVALSTSIALAAVLHRTVERPFERRLRAVRRVARRPRSGTGIAMPEVSA